MGDGISDIADDESRARRYKYFLECLAGHLENPSEVSYEQVEEASENTDAVVRGYWTGRTNLKEGLGQRVEALKKGDKREWARLLSSSQGSTRIYQRLKEVSPFKDNILARIKYGKGFVRINGRDFEKHIEEIIENRNMRTGDSDTYMLVLPQEALEQAEPIWIRCGLLGVDTPRDKEGMPKHRD